MWQEEFKGRDISRHLENRLWQKDCFGALGILKLKFTGKIEEANNRDFQNEERDYHMRNKNLKVLIGMVFITSALSGLAGCSSMSFKSIQTEEKTIASDVVVTTAQYDTEGQNQEAERSFDAEGQKVGTESEATGVDRVSLDEVEIVNAAALGNPKEVLDNMPITSDVEVKKAGEDELQIEFELENVGLCTFAANHGKEFVLPDEVFVDATKIEWTASTADGELIFPYMRVNETGDMFMIDWTYDEYFFAIYGKSPQETSDRDMAGKIALAIIYNLGGAE